MTLYISKAKMLEPPTDQPNRVLVVLDSLTWDAWTKANPQNIPQLLGTKAEKVFSPGCCTLPTLMSYLNNYPPIGVGYGLFDKGIWVQQPDLMEDGSKAAHSPVRAWMPKYYQEKGYHTSIFSGNAVLAETDRDLNISRYFDHWGVMKYLKEEVLRATPRILEDFKEMTERTGKPFFAPHLIGALRIPPIPIFSVLWLFDTHYPFSNGTKVINPHFKDGYATRKAMVEALRYTDETVFPEIVKILKATGRDTKLILTSDHGENHGGVGVGHNPFNSKLRMGEDLFAIPYIEGVIEA